MGNKQVKPPRINEMYLEDIKQEALRIQTYSSGPQTFDASELQKRVYANRFTNRLQTVHQNLVDFAQSISKNMTREHVVVSHRGIKGQMPAPISIRMGPAPDYVRPLPPPPKSYYEHYLEANPHMKLTPLERRMFDIPNANQTREVVG